MFHILPKLFINHYFNFQSCESISRSLRSSNILALKKFSFEVFVIIFYQDEKRKHFSIRKRNAWVLANLQDEQ